eukprot:snap_masked-scaffold_5-processed-gene-2.21-mRNA-1 protein AED:1.00 eAED:1.00 QI:0/0/0/0/1/1/2/0/709
MSQTEPSEDSSFRVTFALLACGDASIFNVSCDKAERVIAILVIVPLILLSPLYRWICCYVPKTAQNTSLCAFFLCCCSPLASESQVHNLVIDYETLRGSKMHFLSDFSPPVTGRTDTSLVEEELTFAQKTQARMKMKRFLSKASEMQKLSINFYLTDDRDSEDSKDDLNAGSKNTNFFVKLFYFLRRTYRIKKYEDYLLLYGPNLDSALYSETFALPVLQNQVPKLALMRKISFFIWFFLPIMLPFFALCFLSVTFGYDSLRNEFSLIALVILTFSLAGCCLSLFYLNVGCKLMSLTEANSTIVSSISVSQKAMEVVKNKFSVRPCDTAPTTRLYNMSPKGKTKPGKDVHVIKIESGQFEESEVLAIETQVDKDVEAASSEHSTVVVVPSEILSVSSKEESVASANVETSAKTASGTVSGRPIDSFQEAQASSPFTVEPSVDAKSPPLSSLTKSTSKRVQPQSTSGFFNATKSLSSSFSSSSSPTRSMLPLESTLATPAKVPAVEVPKPLPFSSHLEMQKNMRSFEDELDSGIFSNQSLHNQRRKTLIAEDNAGPNVTVNDLSDAESDFTPVYAVEAIPLAEMDEDDSTRSFSAHRAFDQAIFVEVTDADMKRMEEGSPIESVANYEYNWNNYDDLNRSSRVHSIYQDQNEEKQEEELSVASTAEFEEYVRDNYSNASEILRRSTASNSSFSIPSIDALLEEAEKEQDI